MKTKKKTFFIMTHGCVRRKVDAKNIHTYLNLNEYKEVKYPNQAEYIFVFTCGGEKSYEEQSVKIYSKLKKFKGKIIVCGCLPIMNPELIEDQYKINSLTPREMGNIDKIFPDAKIKYNDIPDSNELYNTPKKKLFEKIRYAFIYYKFDIFHEVYIRLRRYLLGLSQHFKNQKSVSYEESLYAVRITHGCTGNCAYCNIKMAIGKIKSKTLDQIKTELQRAVDANNFQINLISSDSGGWGADIKKQFPELLHTILDFDERLIIAHIGDLNPKWLVKFGDEIIKIAATGRLKSMLVPIQSGSERILSLMNRSLPVEKFIQIMKKIKEVNPEIVIKTHILVGFPTETKEDLLDTIKLIEKVPFDHIEYYNYYEVKGMRSYDMQPKVDDKTKKEWKKLIARTVKGKYLSSPKF